MNPIIMRSLVGHSDPRSFGSEVGPMSIRRRDTEDVVNALTLFATEPWLEVVGRVAKKAADVGRCRCSIRSRSTTDPQDAPGCRTTGAGRSVEGKAFTFSWTELGRPQRTDWLRRKFPQAVRQMLDSSGASAVHAPDAALTYLPERGAPRPILPVGRSTLRRPHRAEATIHPDDIDTFRSRPRRFFAKLFAVLSS